ncbi:heme-binding protein [Alphaproteobacteria bacterium]|nr:heme-binding protein [Alphaproteobacteria bacterium]
MSYTTTITRVTYLAASKMMAAAVAKADEMGVPQCIAIMDPSGGLICFARTDGAADLAAGPAYAKARVAAERQHPSGALPAEFEVGVAFATDGQYTNLPGGLPIVLDGVHVGGIGASGGSGEDDLAVAHAGLAAIGAS